MGTSDTELLRALNNKEQAPSTAWAFRVDAVHSCAFWENAFTAEECEKIISVGNSKVLQTGSTRANNETGARKSDIAWLHASDGLDWVYRRLTDLILSLNQQFFGFEIFGLTEGLQFTKYQAPDGKYKKHVDSCTNTVVRKLSFSIQLSDPASYEGGDLLLHTSDEPTKMNRARGCLVVFPSYVLHEVVPVTQGVRYSLVSWVTGQPFK